MHLLAFVGALFTARAGTVTTTVAATVGRECAVYLRVPEGDAEVPLVLGMHGTGLYSNGDDRAVSFHGYFLAEGSAAVLHFDKPGVAFADGQPKIDDAIYNRYTQADLTACAENALRWASEQERIGGPVVIAGHSEGSIVAIRLLRSMVDSGSPLLSRVALVTLSAPPLEPWASILDTQLDGRQRALRRALSARDDVAMRALMPLGVAYNEHALAAEAPGDVLRGLADAGVGVPIEVFQGLADENVSPDAVRELERWNAARAEAGLPALRVHARYYEAGHGLNLTAVNDLLMVTDLALQP